MIISMNQLEALTAIALALTEALDSSARYQRLLDVLRGVIPYDAAALLRVEGEELVPVASKGLLPEAVEKRWRRREHPRLDVICNSRRPVLFPPDSLLTDPFDGLIASGTRGARIHACLGCPLYIENRLVGVLTADAFAPNAFSALDTGFVETASALAAAQMQTARFLELLEQRAERERRAARELTRAMHERHGSQLIGRSAALEHLRREIEIVARSDFTVLILGETGSGKEVVARAIHRLSARSHAPLFYMNCAALPEHLAESELFGHERGAFTGAVRARAGKFEVAHGATLLLDEIGELPLAVQPKMLRAIQEGEIQHVGSNRTQRVDVRLLVATNRDLQREVREGRFREDLYHRLNVYPLSVPPLRERKEDIAPLAAHFCGQIARRLGIRPPVLKPDSLAVLERYEWPGNVRELENVLSRAILKASAETGSRGELNLLPALLQRELGTADILPAGPPTPSPAEGKSLRQLTEEFQRALILKTIAAHDGNRAAAARALGLHRSNLHHLAARLGIPAEPKGLTPRAGARAAPQRKAPA